MRRDPIRLRRFLQTYAAHTVGVPPDKSLIDGAVISRVTALAYESAPEMLFVTERIPAWHSNRVKRLVKSPKRVLVEPALMAPLIGVNTKVQCVTARSSDA